MLVSPPKGLGVVDDQSAGVLRISAVERVKNILMFLSRYRQFLTAEDRLVAETEEIKVGLFLVAENKLGEGRIVGRNSHPTVEFPA